MRCSSMICCWLTNYDVSDARDRAWFDQLPPGEAVDAAG
jgi:hypothetical protein